MPKRNVLPLSAALLVAVLCATAQATAPPWQRPAPLELTQALAEGLTPLPAPGGLGTSVVRSAWHIPVVLVSFSDSALTFGQPHFQPALFDTTGATATGSVFDYYRWVSGQRLRVTGRVVATVQLPHDRYYYAFLAGGLNRISTPNNAAGLVRDALLAADDSVDWNEFDLDRDGYVDMLWVVHAGIGGEGSSDPNDMWSITSVLSSYWNNTSTFLSDDFFTGSQTLRMRLDRFTILPELSLVRRGQPSEIGVYCHEFGHALGLPDLYDTADGGRIDAGPGNWSLMSTGGMGGDGVSPESPSHLGAWPMLFLGWAPRLRPAADTSLTLDPIGRGGPVVDVTWQGEEQPEHYLLEVRRREGFDRRLPSEGLIVYHLDEATIGRGLQANAINAGLSPGLVVVEADGRNDLTTGGNHGEARDAFPGAALRASLPEGPVAPNTRTFAGAYTGLALSDIVEQGAAVRFRAHVRAPGWQPAAALDAPATESPRVAGTPRATMRLDDGRIVHVRSEPVGGRAQLVLRRFEAGAWSPGETLPTPGEAWDPALARLPGDGLALVWRDGRDGASRLYYRAWFRGAWLAEQMLTPGSVEVQHPAVACDADGSVIVTWLDAGGGMARLRLRRFPWLSPWGATLTLTGEDEAPEAPTLVADRSGGAWILWRDSSTQPPRAFFRRFHPDSGVSARQTLSATAGGNQTWIAAAVDADDALHAAWVTEGTTWREIHYQRRPKVGTPSPRDTVVEQRLGPIRKLQLAVDPQFGVHLAFEHETDLPPHVRYKRRHPARGWDAYSTEVTDQRLATTAEPELAASSPSDAVVLYLEGGPDGMVPMSRERRGDLTLALAVEDDPPALASGMRAAPNPLRAGRALIVQAAGVVPPAALELFDLAGRRVAAATFEGSPGRWVARVPGDATAAFASGMYFARAGSAGTRRVVVIR